MGSDRRIGRRMSFGAASGVTDSVVACFSWRKCLRPGAAAWIGLFEQLHLCMLRVDNLLVCSSCILGADDGRAVVGQVLNSLFCSCSRTINIKAGL